MRPAGLMCRGPLVLGRISQAVVAEALGQQAAPELILLPCRAPVRRGKFCGAADVVVVPAFVVEAPESLARVVGSSQGFWHPQC